MVVVALVDTSFIFHPTTYLPTRVSAALFLCFSLALYPLPPPSLPPLTLRRTSVAASAVAPSWTLPLPPLLLVPLSIFPSSRSVAVSIARGNLGLSPLLSLSPPSPLGSPSLPPFLFVSPIFRLPPLRAPFHSVPPLCLSVSRSVRLILPLLLLLLLLFLHPFLFSLCPIPFLPFRLNHHVTGICCQSFRRGSFSRLLSRPEV